jgi:hypothetical protein
VSGGGGSRAEEKQRCQRREKADRSQKDSFAIPKSPGTPLKTKISHWYKILMRKMSKAKL